MRKVRYYLVIVFLCLVSNNVFPQLQWPEITSQNKPWTRWWWMGSAVDSTNLALSMDMYLKAGLGGLEIVPIYGAKGYENQFIPYLSAEWTGMLSFTLAYANKLGLGIDMANGTGWPFGGSVVTDDDASKCLYYNLFDLHKGESLPEPLLFKQPEYLRFAGRNSTAIADLRQPVTANHDLQSLAIDQIKYPGLLKPSVVMAYDGSGNSLDITGALDSVCRLNWTPVSGDWKIVALYAGLHGKMVERAAPGGEGYALDHFSGKAVKNYLTVFDEAFGKMDISSLRCFFNDSYEVDDATGQADWTNDFLNEFKTRRGYDLRNFLAVMLQPGYNEELRSRIIYDYRLTINDLILDRFTETWHSWASGREALTRNQAHGSPANILDLYGASDIPETEGNNILRFKFASSAGNVTGKPLVSAEVATWLNDHFLSTLGDVKKMADLCFLGGVNHILYHGTAYSPVSDPWPGWLFYAAMHFQPTNPFWDHFPALNNYVARCQSFLQQGIPDNDVLLYFPIADRFSIPGDRLLRHFDGMEKEFQGTGFRENAALMLQKGYAFDFISDRQIQQLQFTDNHIFSGRAAYQTIVVPGCKYMPVESWLHLFKLAEEGARIIFYKTLPDDVPGLANYEQNIEKFNGLIAKLKFTDSGINGVKKLAWGRGLFLSGGDLNALLLFAGVRRESMVDQQLQFVRKKLQDNTLYFIVNKSSQVFEGWLPLQCQAATVGLFDAQTERKGIAGFRKSADEKTEVFVRLRPDESILIKTFSGKITGEAFPYIKPAGLPIAISGKWTVSFIEGGPELPPEVAISELKSWTDWNIPELEHFSGLARYTIHFKKPPDKAGYYLLNLGIVKESATVRINGNYIGTLIGDEFNSIIDASALKADNQLEITIANTMANRIIYMDKQSIPYRRFYNVNFPANNSENRGPDGLFTAAGWEPVPSGLLGPVTFTPLLPLKH